MTASVGERHVRVEDDRSRVELGQLGEQPHVVVDVVEDPEAEHDVARLDRADALEHVARDELVAASRHVVEREVLLGLLHQTRIVLDADDARRRRARSAAKLNRPSWLARSSTRAPADEVAVRVDQRRRSAR